MSKESFKIVFTTSTGNVVEENVIFECNFPHLAVEQYAARTVLDGGLLGAKVYPGSPLPLVEIGNSGKVASAKAKGCACGRCGTKPPAKPAESKLFNGYTEAVSKGPTAGKFFTENSGWIEAVTWENFAGGSIGIHFRNGGKMIYAASYDDFEAFRLWTDNGGSAGRYYNANVKGIMEVIDL